MAVHGGRDGCIIIQLPQHILQQERKYVIQDIPLSHLPRNVAAVAALN